MDKRLLDLGRQRLENVLDEASGLELAMTDGVELPTATARIPDAIWVLRSGSDEWRLLVEVKSTLWPRGVEGMAAQAKALAAEAKADRCLVIVPRVTERTGKFLERYGIDYIDLSGNTLRVTVWRLWATKWRCFRALACKPANGLGAVTGCDHGDGAANPGLNGSDPVAGGPPAEYMPSPIGPWLSTPSARRLPVEVDPAAQRALEGHPVRQAGVDRDEVRCRDQALPRLVSRFTNRRWAFEHVQHGPVAGCQGVLGLEGGR